MEAMRPRVVMRFPTPYPVERAMVARTSEV